jgi:tellurite resistance protein
MYIRAVGGGARGIAAQPAAPYHADMSQTRYDAIAPLIADAQQEGSTMRVTFRCPVSGQTIPSSAGITAANTVGSRVAQGAKRSLMWSLRSSIAGAVRKAFGHGMAGSMASGATYGAMQGVGSGHSYSEADKRAAIERAFERVQDQFVWDEQNQRFVSAQAAGQTMPDFTRQLAQAPVSAPYDRGVLARMLTEIACADGQLAQDERGFLSSFISPEMGTVDQLAQYPRLSPAELGETTQGPGRETMLMLAWALAFTDEDLSPQEAARLGEFAHQLGVAPERAEALKQYAQVYLVDQALMSAYPGGQRDPNAHAHAMSLAARLGLDSTAAERADIRFRKRYGLV